MKTLSHESKIVLMTCGTLKDLQDKGFVSGPKLLTPKGYKQYQTLSKSGFEITEEEMKMGLEAVQRFTSVVNNQ